MRRHDSGFSLVELLTVIAVIGVVMSVGYTGLRPLLLRQQVGEASSRLSQDLERIRSSAIKYSRDASLVVNGANSYTLSYWDGRAMKTEAVTLPSGVQYRFVKDDAGSTTPTAAPAGGLRLTYTAPYGEVDAINRTILLTPANQDFKNSKFNNRLYVVGVTGQVHR